MNMTHFNDNEFIYFIKIVDDQKEKYYLKSTIDEQNHTILIHLTNFKHSWVGVINQEQVRLLAKKFPSESNDSFYSHTQRAFSNGNKTETDGRSYVFNCKKLDKNRLEFVWKEKIEALNSLKIIGNVELEERPNDEVLSKMMDYTIDEMDMLRAANEQKLVEIKCTNEQLHKALETVKRTVDMKEQLETDLYRKFVLVLNTKKAELAKLKQQIESYRYDHPTTTRDEESYVDSHPRSVSPMDSTFNESESQTNKRRRHQSNGTSTSEDDDIQEIQLTKPTKSKTMNNRQDSSLDLGNDQMDYKTSTIDKHHQRRKFVTATNTISKRPFVNHTATSSSMTVPSLPDDSQTTDDLLNKI
ncbi:hypothetical protein I4U23_023662 [Adineta vaga]|nr:hypothetical protein I4U23_023662 [Adineta vaga]